MARQDSLHIAELELTQNPGALSISGEVISVQAVHWRLDRAWHAPSIPRCFSTPGREHSTSTCTAPASGPRQGPRAKFKLENLAGKLRGRRSRGAADVSLGRDLQTQRARAA